MVGKNSLIPAGEALQKPALHLLQHPVVLLEDGFGPGRRHLPNGTDGVVGAHLFHVQVCDPVGSEHIDILPVVGLHPQLWKCLHHPIQVLRRTGRQIGLHQKFVFLEVIDGRPVGEDHRGIDGGQMDIGSEGPVGAAGGHGKTPPLGEEAVQGLQIPPGHLTVAVIQRVVKITDQQDTVEFSQRKNLNSVSSAASAAERGRTERSPERSG